MGWTSVLAVLLVTLAHDATPAVAQVEISARAARLTVGGRLHVQYAQSSVEDEASRFFHRRARLQLDIAVGEFLTGRLEPDFAGGATVLQDAWVRMSFGDALAVSAGQFKRAFSAFEMASSNDLPVIERDGRVAGVGGCAGVGGTCTFSRLTQRLELDGRDLGLRVEGSLEDRLTFMGTLTNGQGLNQPDTGSGKSLSARLELSLAEQVSVGAYGALHDHVDPETLAGERASAFGADLTLGGWRNGAHLIAGVAAGENWRAGPDVRFLSAQLLGSYYLGVNAARVAGLEPLLRVSWADADRDGGAGGDLLLTPGVMLYFEGRSGVALNLDLFDPAAAGAQTARSLKAQVFLYF